MIVSTEQHDNAIYANSFVPYQRRASREHSLVARLTGRRPDACSFVRLRLPSIHLPIFVAISRSIQSIISPLLFGVQSVIKARKIIVKATLIPRNARELGAHAAETVLPFKSRLRSDAASV